MILILILLAGLGFCTACCVAGFGPPGTLETFQAHGRTTPRRFAQPVDQVVAAYKDGVRRTPGMRVVDESGSTLLVDARPSARVLSGNFGMVLRIDVIPDGSHSAVSTAVSNKVPWSLTNHEGALVQAESVLRMNAKRSSIDELV